MDWMEVSKSAMPPASRPFSYSPFGYDEAATHIRVIRIKPGCGEEIRCVMKRMRRTADRFVPIYSCLSYTWQPENPRRNIYIEKKRGKERVKSIGKNLGDFLSAARDANITDWLWIDALCINQADPIEKGQQVRRMGQTYKHARKVFVWLGLIPKPTVHALENLMRVNLEATKAANQASLGGLISIIPKEAWLGPLTDICSAPYWTRLWIAQEFLLANEPILFFQNFQIDAITLARQLNRFLYLVPKGERLDFMALTGWTYLHWRWVCYEFPSNNKWMPSERRPMDKPVSLASLIPKFAKSGCHDKKDRVYALLSLADDGDPGMVYYEISEDEVFRNTMGVMKRHKNKRPIDEHLLIGEALIEALELWPATSPSSSTLEINFDGPEDITLPIWGRAALEIKAEAGTGWETIEATCMYVGIHDSPNVHVFEYVVEKPAERPIVKYSRAHEYLRSHPPPSSVPASDMYSWLESMPSEALHYFAGPRTSTRPLWFWTAAQKIEISGLRTYESTKHGKCDILPALRIVNSMRSTAGLPWDGFANARVAQRFLATYGWDPRLDSQEYQHDASFPPLAQNPRSTTLHVDVKMDDLVCRLSRLQL